LIKIYVYIIYTATWFPQFALFHYPLIIELFPFSLCISFVFRYFISHHLKSSHHYFSCYIIHYLFPLGATGLSFEKASGKYLHAVLIERKCLCLGQMTNSFNKLTEILCCTIFHFGRRFDWKIISVLKRPSKLSWISGIF